MSLALHYREPSRAPLAFGLSALLHGLLAALLAAFFMFHRSPAPLISHPFELVAGPPSENPPGPSSASGRQLMVPNVSGPAATPPAPQPTPVEPTPAQPTPVEQTAPPQPQPTAINPPQSKPNVTRQTPTPVSRGSTPPPTKQPKVMTTAEWLKQQQQSTTRTSTSNSAPRTNSRPVPNVNVSVGGILQNLGKLSTGTAGTPQVGTSGLQAGSGQNGTSDDYFAKIIMQLQAVFVTPPAVDGLSATIRLVIAEDGTVVSARMIQGSPDARFNAAVNAALARLKNVGPPPNGRQITQDFKFVPTAP